MAQSAPRWKPMLRAVSIENLARLLLKNAERKNIDPINLLETWRRSRGWSYDKVHSIKKMLGQIGGAASKRRAKQKKQRNEVQCRQLDFFK